MFPSAKEGAWALSSGVQRAQRKGTGGRCRGSGMGPEHEPMHFSGACRSTPRNGGAVMGSEAWAIRVSAHGGRGLTPSREHGLARARGACRRAWGRRGGRAFLRYSGPRHGRGSCGWTCGWDGQLTREMVSACEWGREASPLPSERRVNRGTVERFCKRRSTLLKEVRVNIFIAINRWTHIPTSSLE